MRTRFLQGAIFDIDRAVRDALKVIDEIDFLALKTLAGLQPILAKRHYHETGALRWFGVNIVPVIELDAFVADFKPKNGEVGQFLLTIPTEGGSRESAENICRKAAQHSGTWDIVVGISERAWAVVPMARELFALDRVSNDHPELAGDTVARREVFARLAALQALLESELHKAFDNALWFRKNYQPMRLRQPDLNSLASKLADHRFHASPRLHNELLNRQKPSSNAVAAQNILLRNMVLNEGMLRLGIEGFPAEGGLFDSILESTGLYAKKGKRWRFVSPIENEGDPCRLTPMWKAAFMYIKKHCNRTIAVAELFNEWRKPPFGIKDGLMPLLAVAFVLSQRDKLAVYREGIFRAKFDDVDVDYPRKGRHHDPAAMDGSDRCFPPTSVGYGTNRARAGRQKRTCPSGADRTWHEALCQSTTSSHDGQNGRCTCPPTLCISGISLNVPTIRTSFCSTIFRQL